MQHASQMAVARDEELVQTFLPYTAHPAFGPPSRLRHSVGCPDTLQPHHMEDCVKEGTEVRVAIMDQKAKQPALVLKCPAAVMRVPRLMRAGKWASHGDAPLHMRAERVRLEAALSRRARCISIAGHLQRAAVDAHAPHNPTHA